MALTSPFFRPLRQRPRTRGVFDRLGQVDDLQAEPEIRAVRPVTAHGLFVGHPAERPGDLPTQDLPEEAGDQTFDEFTDVVFRNERTFHVQLSEFRLTVGPKVLVAETADDLVIPVEAGHHEQLFEELGGDWGRA